ncbi:hypothetical protein P4O66_004115 [Electrophorus voltai]|uniref:Uncharacterized protein n=1 Tax=Electrophorus voltai TaxID=2609070 RepID=A0AAD8ZQ09_9TELE|nr:hypothetical protein P4O66_004115 [Electrophorus voltai]
MPHYVGRRLWQKRYEKGVKNLERTPDFHRVPKSPTSHTRKFFAKPKQRAVPSDPINSLATHAESFHFSGTEHRDRPPRFRERVQEPEAQRAFGETDGPLQSFSGRARRGVGPDRQPVDCLVFRLLCFFSCFARMGKTVLQSSRDAFSVCSTAMTPAREAFEALKPGWCIINAR